MVHLLSCLLFSDTELLSTSLVGFTLYLSSPGPYRSFCLLTSRARVLRLSLSRLFGSHATGVDTDLLPGLVYLSKFSVQSSCAGIDTSLWKPVYLFFD